MDHDHNEPYDTRVSLPYAKSKLGYLFGPLLIILGIIGISITIADITRGVYSRNLGNNNEFVYTWDENPIWPSFGKGFWVGLILMVAGIIGIISSCENTVTSIYAFAALAGISSILGFYLLISAIIPVQRLTGQSSTGFERTTLGLNSILMAVGILSLFVGGIAGILSCRSVGCCTDRRGYGSLFLHPRGILNSITRDGSQPLMRP